MFRILSSLASVEPPQVYYDLKYPENVIEEVRLSSLQLEAVVYACQQHMNTLADGSRAGFLIGIVTYIIIIIIVILLFFIRRWCRSWQRADCSWNYLSELYRRKKEISMVLIYFLLLDFRVFMFQVECVK